MGGPIGLVADGDVVTLDGAARTLTVDVPDEEMAARAAAFAPPPYKYTRGVMYRYIKTVSSAPKGCVTDE